MKKLSLITLVVLLIGNAQVNAQQTLNIPIPPPPPGSGLKPPPSLPGTRLVVIKPGDPPPAPFSKKTHKKRKEYARKSR